MKITFLGTGTSQGIPIIGSNHPVCLSKNKKDKRLRVSVLLEWENLTLLIDCGPDFRQQVLRANCTQIDAVLFTHEHSDHTAGIDDLRPFYYRQGDILAYAHERVVKALEKRFGYIFKSENKYPGVLTFDFKMIKNAPFLIKNKEIIPIQVYHYKLAVFGFRTDDFAYITDAKTVPNEEIDKLQDLEVLVVNALRKEPHISHFNLEEALTFIELVKPKKAYLTHISHHLGFHDEVQKTLPKNVFLAYDELKITI